MAVQRAEFASNPRQADSPLTPSSLHDQNPPHTGSRNQPIDLSAPPFLSFPRPTNYSSVAPLRCIHLRADKGMRILPKETSDPSNPCSSLSSLICHHLLLITIHLNRITIRFGKQSFYDNLRRFRTSHLACRFPHFLHAIWVC